MDNLNLNVEKINLQSTITQIDTFISYFSDLSNKEQRTVIKRLENIYLSKLHFLYLK